MTFIYLCDAFLSPNIHVHILFLRGQNNVYINCHVSRGKKTIQIIGNCQQHKKKRKDQQKRRLQN